MTTKNFTKRIWQAPDAQLEKVWKSVSTTLGDHAEWPAFDARLREHLPALRDELNVLYGQRADFTDFLIHLLGVAFRAWCERPKELKALDDQREADPHWFESQKMLGGVCYVDLFAGNFKGIEAQIPYFKELGLTYPHLMPPFLRPEPHS